MPRPKLSDAERRTEKSMVHFKKSDMTRLKSYTEKFGHSIASNIYYLAMSKLDELDGTAEKRQRKIDSVANVVNEITQETRSPLAENDT